MLKTCKIHIWEVVVSGEAKEKEDKLPIPHSQIQIVLLAGYSGLQISALVRQVHKQITARKGYFLSDKFDK